MRVFTSFIILVLGVIAEANHQQILQPEEQLSQPRIAIIGAGAGGSSASYYLQKYTSDGYNISIFEKTNYIGGRSTTIPIYGNKSATTEVIELGGSVFVEANKILTNAVKQFNLTTSAFAAGSDEKNGIDGSISIWDGSEFILELDSSWWRAPIKLLWRYGKSPLRARWSKDKFVKLFLQYYYDDLFPFNNLTDVVIKSHFDNATLISGDDILSKYGVSFEFRHDLIQASTRCNYAQNLNQIHGVGALVSLASDGAVQVSGGNWQIFEKFIEQSNAYLHLNTIVKSITKTIEGNWRIKYQQEGQDYEEEFDQVIVAAPLNQTNIELNYQPSVPSVPSVDYVKLHVTIFTSNITISPLYFNSKLTKLPNYIFTTTGTSSPEFNAISLLTRVENTGDYVYKIFSPQPIEAEFLHDELFKGKDVNISWWYKHVWYLYPYLKPTNQFGEFKLDDDGLWYLNIIESFASTMETLALAGASVAGLISQGKNTTQIVVP